MSSIINVAMEQRRVGVTTFKVSEGKSAVIPNTGMYWVNLTTRRFAADPYYKIIASRSGKAKNQMNNEINRTYGEWDEACKKVKMIEEGANEIVPNDIIIVNDDDNADENMEDDTSEEEKAVRKATVKHDVKLFIKEIRKEVTERQRLSAVEKQTPSTSSS